MRLVSLAALGFCIGLLTQSAFAGRNMWNIQAIWLLEESSESHALRAHHEVQDVDTLSSALTPSEFADVCDADDALAALESTVASPWLADLPSDAQTDLLDLLDTACVSLAP